MVKETLQKANELLFRIDYIEKDLKELNSISEFKEVPEAKFIIYDSYKERTICIELEDNLMYCVITLIKNSLNMELKNKKKEFENL